MPSGFLTALLFRFVRRVATVVLAVALPASGDAAPRVFAPELVDATSHLGWIEKQFRGGDI